MRLRVLLLLLLAMLLVQPGRAQSPELNGLKSTNDPKKKGISFTLAISPADPFATANQASGKPEYRRGERLLLTIQGKLEDGYYTYPAVALLPGQAEEQRSKIHLGKGFVPIIPIRESKPKTADEPGIGKYNKFTEPFTWEQDVLIRPDLAAGKQAELAVTLKVQVCKTNCVIQEHKFTIPVQISAEQPVPWDASTEALVKAHDESTAKEVRSDTTTSVSDNFWREYTVVNVGSAVGVQGKDSGLSGLLLSAILAGFISLATPCVFPMIPITVSIFIKQGETNKGSAILKAIVYCMTLVIVLTIGGIALGSVLQTISQHWATNLLLTGIFIFFGLSLLGAYDITLPSWLSDTTATGENKGGLLGVAFMALTFSIISFACVGPIYGGFTALSASGSASGWTARILAPLAFSLAFASPFFVLALFPSLLKSMPRSGSWMNTVKVVMGFLELAAAFKFVRAAELNWLKKSEYFTFDLVMGIYVALAIGAALYLFTVYRLPHDHDAPESISVTRLVFGLIFLSLAFYFLPGVFKDEKGQSQKPRGVVYEWTRSFLLPDDPSPWSADLAAALARAEREDKPLFIDFTGLG